METTYLGKCNITYWKGANSPVLYYTENSIGIASTQLEFFAFLRFIYHFNIFVYTISSHYISVISSDLAKGLL